MTEFSTSACRWTQKRRLPHQLFFLGFFGTEEKSQSGRHHLHLRGLLARVASESRISNSLSLRSQELDEGVVCSMRLPVLERLPACKGKPAPSRRLTLRGQHLLERFLVSDAGKKSQAACRGRTCQLHLKLLTCSAACPHVA